MSGQIAVGEGDGARYDRKPGDIVDPTLTVAPRDRPRFVSRGGEKLDAALEAFAIDVHGLVCLDVGASTGGFTDALLRRGASRVYALDVGRGQLAEPLRHDARVVSMERTHAARLSPSSADHVALPEQPSFAVIDVSFISLTRVLDPVLHALTGDARIVALVKPQFEVEPADAPRGVVRDPVIQRAAVDAVTEHARSLGLAVRGVIVSPLLGPAGNREVFVHLGHGAGAA